MLSKKNQKLNIWKCSDRHQHFALLKLSTGLVSVLIGFSFIGALTVNADTSNDAISNQQVVTESDSSGANQASQPGSVNSAPSADSQNPASTANTTQQSNDTTGGSTSQSAPVVTPASQQGQPSDSSNEETWRIQVTVPMEDANDNVTLINHFITRHAGDGDFVYTPTADLLAHGVPVDRVQITPVRIPASYFTADNQDQLIAVSFAILNLNIQGYGNYRLMMGTYTGGPTVHFTYQLPKVAPFKPTISGTVGNTIDSSGNLISLPIKMEDTYELNITSMGVYVSYVLPINYVFYDYDGNVYNAWGDESSGPDANYTRNFDAEVVKDSNGNVVYNSDGTPKFSSPTPEYIKSKINECWQKYLTTAFGSGSNDPNYQIIGYYDGSDDDNFADGYPTKLAQADNDDGSYTFQMVVIYRQTQVDGTAEKVRTIRLHQPTGTKVIRQVVDFQKSFDYDAITGEALTTEDWKVKDGTQYKELTANNHNWAAYTPASVAGYTLSVSEVPAQAVSASDDDQTVDVDYTADPQLLYVYYVDDGDQGRLVSSKRYSGNTGQLISLGLQVPAGYQLAADQTLPVYYTFSALSDQSLTIHLTKKSTPAKHHPGQVVKPGNPTNQSHQPAGRGAKTIPVATAGETSSVAGEARNAAAASSQPKAASDNQQAEQPTGSQLPQTGSQAHAPAIGLILTALSISLGLGKIFDRRYA